MPTEIPIRISLTGFNSDAIARDVEPSICASKVAENPANLAARFLESCRAHPSRIAATDSDRKLSFEQLEQSALRLASRLVNSGDFEIGDHVGLNLASGIQYVVAFYGTLLAGGVVVPLPQYENRRSIEQLCQLAHVKFVASHDDGARTGDLPSVGDDGLCPLPLHVNELSFAKPDSVAMLMFTSGSTGQSKAVMLSHRNLIANCDSILGFLPIDAHDRTLAVMPFCHALGNSVLQTHVLSGAQLVFESECKTPSQIMNAMARHRCTSLTAVPQMIAGMSGAAAGEWNACLKYVAVAGGAMDAIQARRLQAQIKPAKLYLMYGQTEATARLAWLPPEQLATAAESIGNAIPGVELAIQTESGEPATSTSPGVLYARGDNVMLGYWQDGEATRCVLNDGWLCTGDLAFVRRDGFIQICGRDNELVKIQGYRFHPTEIENRVRELMKQTDLIATGFDFYGQQRIALFVVAEPELPATQQHVRSVCRQVLPPHMMPQRIKILEAWPMNAAGKVDRLALRESLNSRKGLAGAKNKSTIAR